MVTCHFVLFFHVDAQFIDTSTVFVLINAPYNVVA